MRGLARELRHPIFLAGAVLYLVASLFKRNWLAPPGWWPSLLAHHLADFLTLPLLLTLEQWVLRRWYFRQPSFRLPTSWIFSSWVAISLWFEGLLPRFSSGATADPWDVVAYALGGLVFWRWMNRP